MMWSSGVRTRQPRRSFHIRQIVFAATRTPFLEVEAVLSLADQHTVAEAIPSCHTPWQNRCPCTLTDQGPGR